MKTFHWKFRPNRCR